MDKRINILQFESEVEVIIKDEIGYTSFLHSYKMNMDETNSSESKLTKQLVEKSASKMLGNPQIREAAECSKVRMFLCPVLHSLGGDSFK